ncbi:MAG TPA: caspase family protein [Methanomassiliicoccales archaeon]|nr:caspase family protein [Methanomassiliicoccales archaeon]
MNKALLVGINKYKLPGSDLQGCVNDVTNIRHSLLTYFGFTVKQIRVVTDERATKKNIMTRLEWLVKGAKPGDRLVFHYSGHGSQIRDRDGDELKDRLDEIICPHDMDWDGTYIVDDELARIFSKIPKGAHLEVFLDSCHSGTATREMRMPEHMPERLPGEDAPAAMTVKQRYLPPPVDILCREEEDLPVHRLLKGMTNPSSHVLFSGCRENQTSADAYISKAYNGAFTYYLCKHLRDTAAAITRAELLKRVRASLKFNDFDQITQLEAPTEKKKKKVLE